MARRLDEQYLTPRRAGIADILRRAIAAGQLRADTDVEMTIDLMVGAAVYRWLVTAQPVGADAARRGRRPALRRRGLGLAATISLLADSGLNWPASSVG
jgi:Tetracyclin repressor-like, C-terminal domain